MTILLHICAITSACKISKPYIYEIYMRSDVSRYHYLQSLCDNGVGGGRLVKPMLTEEVGVGIT